MFRRKEDGTEELITDSAETVTPVITPAATPATPVNPVPAAPAAQAASFRPAPPQAAMAGARGPVSAPAAAAPAPVSAPEAPRPAAVSPSAPRPATPSAAPASAHTKRVLTVGPEIHMKGEIASCDRVVIEGVVDATMRDVHTVELTETGTLKGTAEVEDAEISGTFEGDLLVRGKLTIHASGRVRGNVTYGEVEIQRGGQISGNIRNVADAKAAAASAPKKAAA